MATKQYSLLWSLILILVILILVKKGCFSQRGVHSARGCTVYSVVSIALEMASGQNIEHLTIVQCTSKLVTTISLHPLKLSQKLFEKNLVSDSQVSESLSQAKDDYSKASNLLDIVTRQIEAYPDKYESFLSILNEFPWSQDVVKDMRSQYKTNKTMVTIQYYDDDTLSKITEENKKKLELNYAILVADVAKRLEKIHADFNSLRVFATTYFPEEKQKLAETTSITGIFEALSGLTKWKCNSISALEVICKKFGNSDEKLMSMIHDYKSGLAGFRATTKIVHFMKHNDSNDIVSGEPEPDHAPTIQQTMSEYDIQYCHNLSLKLKERVTEKCLDYIHQLWASLAEYLLLPALPALLKKIQHGCIEVTWLISTETVRHLLRKLQRPAEVAQRFKITKIKLDHQILYSEEDREDCCYCCGLHCLCHWCCSTRREDQDM